MGQAFEQWLYREFPDRNMMASHIVLTVSSGAAGEMYWELLEETGDKTYSKDTFLKVADNVIKRMEGKTDTKTT
jgi:hypothetical protein